MSSYFNFKSALGAYYAKYGIAFCMVELNGVVFLPLNIRLWRGTVHGFIGVNLLH